MKKRVFLIAAAVMVASLFGCKDKESGNVTLGQYKGIELTEVSEEVTDEELAEELAWMFRDKVIDGDTINLDFTGYLDGETEPFEGGSATGYTLSIGSNTFIDGFEDGLIGAKVGEEVTLNLTFPDGYGNGFDNKKVKFVCKVNSISYVTAPELTLAYVTENTEYTTVEEYKEAVRAQMLAQKVMDAEEALYTEVLDKLTANCEVKKLDEKLREQYYQEAVTYYESSIEEYHYYYYMLTGETLSGDAMLQMLGITQEQLDAELNTVADENTKAAMIFLAIADKEKIEVTDAEYQEHLAEYVSGTGLDTPEEFFEKYGYTEETFKNDLLIDKVMEFVVENAVYVKATE
ncbi:MAG: FKBP-type peptidyl-prolyl cis-trans isomerase [Lachnospiraceae bacterium]|nr:FKBP-type peptidyl-prolyl cis-trans isomerase [Lachnospiraceae bacterium]